MLRSISKHCFCRIFNQPISSQSRSVRVICTTAVDRTFWEPNKKGDYDTVREKLSTLDSIRDGLKDLKNEISIWKDEQMERLRMDPIATFRPGKN
jgi:NADH dehydrogenase [ubiquinone] 1 alpha subcomplex assembly factor 1